MKAAVILFPGSNREGDAARALKQATGRQPDIVWHADHDLPTGTDLVVLPGGFSYGDYLRCGAIAGRAPIMDAVRKHASRGGYVLGICNGFQILCESGLLPGVLMRNAGLRFLCKSVTLEVATTDSAFTRGYAPGQRIAIPIAHHDGNYFADADTLAQLRAEDRIAFTYTDNPNGSTGDIAGILSANRRVLGMMPHPERAISAQHGGTDGVALFEGLMGALALT